MQNTFKKNDWFSVTNEELKTLLAFRRKPERMTSIILFIVAAILGPITIFGALILGYKRAYTRFMYPNNEFPKLYPLKPITRVSMILGAIIAWLAVIAIVWAIITFLPAEWVRDAVFLYYMAANLMVSGIVYGVFRRWQISVNNMLVDLDKHASSQFAKPEELKEYLSDEGLFVGGDYAFNDKGHGIMWASTRSGKGVNIIIPNILRFKNYRGNMTIIDLKGENCAVTANALRSQGKNVVILNPFEILPENISGNVSYNPLAILSDKSSPHLVDDVMLIAENLVPIKPNDHNEYFTTGGRQIIAALLLHIVTSDKFSNPTLADLWRVLRLSGDAWDNMLADMATCTDPMNGEAVRGAANEIVKNMLSPESFASCLSNALQATDIFKSSLLNKAMLDGFDPYSLSMDDNTVVFVILPFDKLQSHSRWLRLVTSTLMRSIVRKPNPKIRNTFIIDEAFSQGYNSEFEIALAGYSGFGISLFLIYQDLPQIVATYGQDKWQSILGNCQIRLCTGVKDNFSASYISEAFGKTTRTVYSKNRFGVISNPEHIERDLATPDEVKRMSKDNLILFVGENTFTALPKRPYYRMPELRGKYDPNPYIAESQ